MQRLLRVHGETVDTLHYPGQLTSQPTHETVVLTYRSLEPSNERGGRVTDKRTKKPVIRAYARSQDVLDEVFHGVGIALEAEEDDNTESCPVDYGLISMANDSMQSTIAEHNKQTYDHRLKGKTTNETNESIQSRLEVT